MTKTVRILSVCPDRSTATLKEAPGSIVDTLQMRERVWPLPSRRQSDGYYRAVATLGA